MSAFNPRELSPVPIDTHKVPGGNISAFRAGGGRRSRYVSPGDVMRRKGCIGCGGAGVIAALGTMVAAALILL